MDLDCSFNADDRSSNAQRLEVLVHRLSSEIDARRDERREQKRRSFFRRDDFAAGVTAQISGCHDCLDALLRRHHSCSWNMIFT